MKSIAFFRQKYPKFIYQSYRYRFTQRCLRVFFDFRIEPDIRFTPSLVIKNVDYSRFKKIKKEVLNNFIFHLGLMEIPSYWKVTCAPEIVIRAGYLNKEQIKWWQDLIMKGMGQFFYENNLGWQKPLIRSMFPPSFRSKITCASAKTLSPNWLVPMGGGKDSIVTLEKLQRQGKKVNVFVVNPNSAVKGVLKIAGIKNPVIVERKIDPKLLELNKREYLNGHTPFTAVLSFLAVFCAVLFSYKNIAFSNEKSADEGNVKYQGRVVNHQWSKSSEFEKKFKNYVRKYLISDINYFSYLRKYSELEIAKMFIEYPQYFQVFVSCNQAVAKKLKKRWCGNCPKCLFVYLILCPYLEKKELLKIFGKDLLREPKLSLVLNNLIGERGHKPLECVGTYKESRKALKLCLEKS